MTWIQRSRSLQARGVVLSLFLFGALGCATQGPQRVETRTRNRLEVAGFKPRAANASPTSLETLYDEAIVNSAVYRQAHQSSDLSPVTGTAKMVSFISCENCDSCDNCNCPKQVKGCSSKCCLEPGSQTAPTDIWVSLSDQFLQFCGPWKDLPADQVILKIQQLQGLPPQINFDPCTWQILEVQVSSPQVPSQFFRPCTNPDPTTQGPCTVDFDPLAPEATVAFQAWIAEQALSSWQIPGGYPWTHLGYTYNWDPAAASIVGTSEYVIPAGAPVQVTGLVPAIEYCTQGRLTCP